MHVIPGALIHLLIGFSDDAFDYFRGWLISQGREVFEQTIKNPEFLADYISDENLGEEEVPEFEDFLSIGFNAYTLKKGGDPEEWDGDLYDEMQDLLANKGLKFNSDIEFDWEDEDDLAEMCFQHYGSGLEKNHWVIKTEKVPDPHYARVRHRLLEIC
ncbi:DUF4240 domain-containing protein [Bacillus salipaludis]|uniref:DUF4240 domain-containing protein n=1 Tax=Bacillus salipaludis TaxID=2547811 RepID=A0ABW8RB90_9BACI